MEITRFFTVATLISDYRGVFKNFLLCNKLNMADNEA